MRFVSKTSDICSTGCYWGEATTTIIIILKKNKIQQQSLRIVATLRFRAICVYKRKEIPPPIYGGGFSKLYLVTSQTHRSRPITLGHYTSWSADSAVNNDWKHFYVDTSFSWVPRRLRKQTGDPRTDDTIKNDPIIKCFPDLTLWRYHALITLF